MTIYYRQNLEQKTQQLEEFIKIKLYQVQDLVDVQLQNQKIAVIGEVDFEQSLWSIDQKQKIIYGKSHTYLQNKCNYKEIREIHKDNNSSVEIMIQNEFFLRDLCTHQIHLEVFGIMKTQISIEACNYIAKIYKIPDIQIHSKEGEWIIQNCITQNCPIIVIGNVRFMNGIHRMNNPEYICQFQQDIKQQLQQELLDLKKNKSDTQLVFLVFVSGLAYVFYKSIIQ